MEDVINYGKDMTLEELENLEEVKLEIDEGAFEVSEGVCPYCNEKFVKIVENRKALGGDVTFHIKKLKCIKCGKEYLDLNDAEKYDLLLILEKAFKQPINVLSKKVEKLI